MIGRHQGVIGGIGQEFLSWYDEQGNRYLMAEEKLEKLAQHLRSLGIDPENLPSNP